VLGRPFAAVTRLFTAPVYGSIRAVARVVGAELDSTVANAATLLGESVPGARREATLALLNGVLGDYLEESGNPLAIEMRLRHECRPLDLRASALRAAIPDATRKLLVLVHGSCLSDRCWTRGGHHHGGALARDLGFTAVHVQYNTGLHISRNGTALATLLERLVAEWPVEVEELAIVGHSMGGLVARSACHAGDAAGHRWRRKLGKLVCIGSPHHGAALERGGHWIDALLGISGYSAPLARLGRIRSAGVTDLRFGNVLDEHWKGRDRFASGRDDRASLRLPGGVQCYAIAGTKTAAPGGGRYAGDGLVSVDSALGRHPRPELALAFPEAHQWIALGTGHLDLLGSPAVYEVLRSWLSREAPPVSPAERSSTMW
jgi:pimeloyl-ACP methyl ester carboxylesterase